MNAHERAVDHLHLSVVRLDDGVHQAVPDAGLAPAVEAVVCARVRPIALRQIAPRGAGPQHPKDAVQNTPIVSRFGTPAVHRQNRFDNAPLEVGEVVAHDPSSDASQLESLFAPIRQ